MFSRIKAANVAKLLLVEDDNNLREIYQARLSAEGYEIVAAQNGEEALSIAKQHRPDLIISDVMMPRISGFEMLDILRATPELANTKVIMLTALGQAEDQARAGKLGADKYLVKSQVTLEDIVNCASDLLNGTTVVSPNPDQQLDTPVTPNPAVSATATSVVADQSVAPAVSQDATTNVTATTEQPEPTAVPTLSPVAPAAVPTTPPAQPADPSLAQSVTPAVVTTVQDPDPLAPPPPPTATPLAPAPEPVPIVTHKSGMMSRSDVATLERAPRQPAAANPESLTSAPPETQPSPVALDQTRPVEQQTAIAEGTNTESQIAAFANTQPATTLAPATPNPESLDIAAANEATLATAVENLAAAAHEPPTLTAPPSEKVVLSEEPPVDTNGQVPEPANIAPPNLASAKLTVPETAATTAVASPDESAQANVVGKKVITPINDISKGPNLDELLAEEVAKEEAAAGVPVSTAPAATTEPVAPAQPEATNPPTGDDPNSIAL